MILYSFVSPWDVSRLGEVKKAAITYVESESIVFTYCVLSSLRMLNKSSDGDDVC